MSRSVRAAPIQQPPHREVCLRCRRPVDVCWCTHLSPRQTKTRIVLLQHPREARVAVGTARMAHLSLPNSELHEGVDFSGHPRVRELSQRPGTYLLFPGEGAIPPAEVPPGAIEHLIVVDGTWPQARKVLKENPVLRQLPRLGLAPRRPGNYRIRREPTADSLATIEAVVEVLGLLENDAPAFDAMLRAFDWMVDQQLSRTATREGPPRHKKPRRRPELPETRLLSRKDDLVAIHVEVNAHARGSLVTGTPELLHLYARRISSGEVFDAVLAPRRPLSSSAPFHLGLDADRILAGEPVDAARRRWKAFLRERDVLCTWGPYPVQQLQLEAFDTTSHFDLRLIVARRKQSRPGTPQEAARALGIDVPDLAAPRAERTVGALSEVVRGLELNRGRTPRI